MRYNFFHYHLPVLFFCLIGYSLAAHPVALPKQDYEKNYHEVFSIAADGLVQLDNRYGEIRVTTWDQPSVDIAVRVKVSAEDQEAADATFSRIEISFSHLGNGASATTRIANQKTKGTSLLRDILNGDWEWSWGSKSGSDFKIYYDVKMPATAELATTARYCDVELPDLLGNTRLEIRYGDLFAGALKGARNDLELAYSEARIKRMAGRSELNVRYSEGSILQAEQLRYEGRYSEFRIGEAEELTLDVNYEELEIENARSIRMRGNYCDIEVENVGMLDVDGNYNDWSVNRVTEELLVDAAYGDFEVEQVAAGFKQVYIRTSYIDVEVGVAAGAGYSLKLRSSYGSIRYDEDRVADAVQHKESHTASVSGQVSGRGNGLINISTSYGDIEVE